MALFCPVQCVYKLFQNLFIDVVGVGFVYSTGSAQGLCTCQFLLCDQVYHQSQTATISKAAPLADFDECVIVGYANPAILFAK